MLKTRSETLERTPLCDPFRSPTDEVTVLKTRSETRENAPLCDPFRSPTEEADRAQNPFGNIGKYVIGQKSLGSQLGSTNLFFFVGWFNQPTICAGGPKRNISRDFQSREVGDRAFQTACPLGCWLQNPPERTEGTNRKIKKMLRMRRKAGHGGQRQEHN